MRRLTLLLTLCTIGCDPKVDTLSPDGDTAMDTGTAAVDADGDGFAEADDCNDSDPSINPDAVEVCDGIDNDCDDLIDDTDNSWDPSSGTTWYADMDSDGYGNDKKTAVACEALVGTSAKGGDCDDANSMVSPGETEICDGLDNDCDDLIDDADDSLDTSTTTVFYEDRDGDGYGATDVQAERCQSDSGYVSDNTDCNDELSSVNPGAQESCNGIDDDCNLLTTEDGSIDVAGVGYADLSLALAAAAYGDTVTLCDGEYIGPFVVPDGVTLTSFNGAYFTSLVGDGSGVAATLTLDGAANILDLTFRDGFSLLGGAIDGYSGSMGGDVSIYNCIFENNNAGYGGAILANLNHTLTVVDSEFRGNLAGVTDGTNYYGSGGAIYAASADLQGVTFEDNEAYFGGGLYIQGDAVVDAYSIFQANLASSYSGSESGYGGGFYCNEGSIIFDGTEITDNEAIYFGGGGLTLNCDISGGVYDANVAGVTGGGLYFYSADANQLDNATLSNNAATYGGGLMLDGASGSGIFTVSDIAVSDNTASLAGGGLWALGAIVDMTDASFDGNDAVEGGGGAYLGGADTGADTRMVADAVDFTNNTSANGAGIYVDNSELDLSNGVVNGNVATTSGGGAFLYDGQLSSTASDWGTSTADNSPDDVYIDALATGYDDYESAETFDCDVNGCQ